MIRFSPAMKKALAGGAGALALLGIYLNDKEDTRLIAYQDGSAARIWTICDGLTSYQGKPVYKGMTLTAQQCAAESARRHQLALNWLQQNIPAKAYATMSEPQKAGLASFCYWNLGPNKCRYNANGTKTRVWSAVERGDWKEVCARIPDWIRDGGKDCRIRSNNCYGQVDRRDEEAALACWGVK